MGQYWCCSEWLPRESLSASLSLSGRRGHHLWLGLRILCISLSSFRVTTKCAPVSLSDWTHIFTEEMKVLPGFITSALWWLVNHLDDLDEKGIAWGHLLLPPCTHRCCVCVCTNMCVSIVYMSMLGNLTPLDTWSIYTKWKDDRPCFNKHANTLEIFGCTEWISSVQGQGVKRGLPGHF